tara:strand:+ start:59 stop:943 length:885 start_codon:yes stop_codon:yes gene_type:complete
MANGHSAIDSLIANATLQRYQEGGEVKPTVGQRFVQRFPSQHKDPIRAAEQERALTGLIDFIAPQSLGELGLMMAAGPVASKAGKISTKFFPYAYSGSTPKIMKMAKDIKKNPRSVNVDTKKLTESERAELYGRSIGLAQREAPEEAMVRVQRAYGGGVLGFAIEAMGDIPNRMYTWAGGFPGSFGVTSEKIDRVLRTLKHEYGFAREMKENMIDNARFNKIPFKEYERKLNKELQSYKKAHSELPAFNEVQKLVKEANIEFGNQNWEKVISNLETVQKHMNKGQESFFKKVLE